MSHDASFDWNKFVDYAKEISDNEDACMEKEYLFRTGISRVYYGLYNLCVKFAIDHDLITRDQLKKTNTSHKDLIYKFINSDRFDVKYGEELNNIKTQVGEILLYLRDYRTDADYKDIYPNDAERHLFRDLERAVEDSKDVIGYLQKLYDEISEQKCS